MSEDSVAEDIYRTPPHLNPPARYEFFLIFAKILITVMFMFPLAHYSIYGGDKSLEKVEDNGTVSNNVIVMLQEEIAKPNKTKKIKMKLIFPPSCPITESRTVLDELCEDYNFKSTSCTPEDFENEEKHKIPMKSIRRAPPSDPRANIVSFVTVGFLVVSLIATFVELYKAKKQSPAKTKAPLTRKCSLADLTIMKHHRKELVRRDSVLEGHDESKQPALFKKAPPLQRSSSTPVEPISETSKYSFSRSFDSRRCSIVDNHANDTINQRMVLERRGSFLERKPSIIDGKIIERFDLTGRRISTDITNSPERKHHSRLVHRH